MKTGKIETGVTAMLICQARLSSVDESFEDSSFGLVDQTDCCGQHGWDAIADLLADDNQQFLGFAGFNCVFRSLI